MRGHHFLRRLLSEVIYELRTTFLLADKWGESTKEGQFTGLWWGKGPTHTHIPLKGVVCVCVRFVETVPQRNSQKYTSACGRQGHSTWRWLTPGKVLCLTGHTRSHLVPACFWFIHIYFRYKFKKEKKNSNISHILIFLSLFFDLMSYLQCDPSVFFEADTPTVIINTSVNTEPSYFPAWFISKPLSVFAPEY